MDNAKIPTPLIDLAIEASKIEHQLMGDQPDKALIQLLDQISQDLSSKADHYHYMLRHLKSVTEMLKLRAQEFSDASKVLDNAQEKMRERIKTAMQILGTQEIKGFDVVFKLSGMNRKLVIKPDQLPIRFMIAETIYKPDKDAIEVALDQGLTIEGVHVIESPTLRTSVNKGTK